RRTPPMRHTTPSGARLAARPRSRTSPTPIRTLEPELHRPAPPPRLPPPLRFLRASTPRFVSLFRSLTHRTLSNRHGVYHADAERPAKCEDNSFLERSAEESREIEKSRSARGSDRMGQSFRVAHAGARCGEVDEAALARFSEVQRGADRMGQSFG